MTEDQSPSAIQDFATTAVGGDQWDAANYAADIIKDFNRAHRHLLMVTRLLSMVLIS
ncbi:hypothetical protein LCGC14_1494570 [marine sediment metagenome]|uniref:Uncharacterized protein n=1 Tax=marine sediment metagenome TaxID=412755 RepID=A0A0F9J6D9_9ZZZZ